MFLLKSVIVGFLKHITSAEIGGLVV